MDRKRRGVILLAGVGVLAVVWVVVKMARSQGTGAAGRVAPSYATYGPLVSGAGRSGGWQPGLGMAITQDRHVAALRALGFPQTQAQAASRS